MQTSGPQPTQPKPEQKEVQSLTLKVMRLSKPSFQTNLPVNTEDTDICGALQRFTNIGIEYFGMSDLLSLPHAFGNISLGENFSSYISIHNHSPFDVKNVTVKAELQTATQRFSLLEITGNAISVFASGESHDYVVAHDVKEVGVHILVCTVNYVKHDGEKKYFRKFFKFQVSNPISVKTQTYELQNVTFLSAQIQNITQLPLFIDSVKFDPLPLFSLHDLNANESTELVYLKPSDVFQFLFRLEPKHDRSTKVGTVLGKIDIVWKSTLGETGRLQTAPLERKVHNQLELELTVKKIPSQIILETPFCIQCELVNCSERIIAPKLSFLRNKMTGVLVNGLSGQQIVSQIPPGGSVMLDLSLFPLKPGVQKITGIRIVDDLTTKMYDFSDFLDVFVET